MAWLYHERSARPGGALRPAAVKVIWLEPQPAKDERPTVFPSPFDQRDPHALAQRCAEVLKAELRAGVLAPGISTDVLRGADSLGGKMFGVLAFEARDGRAGFIRALSGQLGRAWNVEGYAPPLFDVELRAAVEPPAELVVKSLTARVEEARANLELVALREDLIALEHAQVGRRAELKQRHAANKAARRAQRESTTEAKARHELDQLSRGDDAERRRHEATCRDERDALLSRLRPLERRLAALERLRRLVSREAMRRIWDSYVLTSFSGERTTLRDLFPEGDPPSGAADCAAPRLLDAARRNGWKPLALAELWWGDAPPGGSRVEGAWYPACLEKCGPVLPFLMRGLEVAPRHTHQPPKLNDELIIAHEDARFLVVDKPAGLLSVKARDEGIGDFVVARVLRRFPNASGPIAVHRLDLDTSGLLLCALDEETYRVLQEQFVSRSVEKKYVAVLEGVVDGDEGEVNLPMRVDLEQRPRQLVDFEHGKPATTRWKVLSRTASTTRVAFFPLTGRTHQLRVHAAIGLKHPIVGDRLYGTPGLRLLLHAEELQFTHPVNGQRIVVTSAAPF
jgi:tRNA pseudouridine32 synthase/23S rRNA pseudouridine746 synthase